MNPIPGTSVRPKFQPLCVQQEFQPQAEKIAGSSEKRRQPEKTAAKPGLAHPKLHQALAPTMQNQLACL